MKTWAPAMNSRRAEDERRRRNSIDKLALGEETCASGGHKIKKWLKKVAEKSVGGKRLPSGERGRRQDNLQRGGGGKRSEKLPLNTLFTVRTAMEAYKGPQYERGSVREGGVTEMRTEGNYAPPIRGIQKKE